MSSDDLCWEPQFCLSCDKQTEGPAYCSESCRLVDFEKSSSSTSTPLSSPGCADVSFFSSQSKPSSRFYLAPAYDFGSAQPYGSAQRSQRSYTQGAKATTTSDGRVLSPSSSHSSLSSLRSTSSAGSDGQQLSEKSKKQLRDYASSFDHVRLQRRRSY
jgi:hypothetical protein